MNFSKIIQRVLWIFIISSLNAQTYDKIEDINYLPNSLFVNGLDSTQENGKIGIHTFTSVTGFNPSLHFKVDTSYSYFDILSVSFFYPNDPQLSINPQGNIELTFLETMPWYSNLMVTWNTNSSVPWENIPVLATINQELQPDSSTLTINSSESINFSDFNWSWYEIDLSNEQSLQNLTSENIWIQLSLNGLFPVLKYNSNVSLDSTFYHNFYNGNHFSFPNTNDWFVIWDKDHSKHLMCKIKIGYHDLPSSISESRKLPKTFSLSQNFPNPFNPSTVINYDLGNKNYDLGKLSIYNTLGKVIKEFVISNPNGSVIWDGTNELGKSVSSGTYFYELKVGNLTQKRKMVLMK